jgi:hypothetical protein
MTFPKYFPSYFPSYFPPSEEEEGSSGSVSPGGGGGGGGGGSVWRGHKWKWEHRRRRKHKLLEAIAAFLEEKATPIEDFPSIPDRELSKFDLPDFRFPRPPLPPKGWTKEIKRDTPKPEAKTHLEEIADGVWVDLRFVETLPPVVAHSLKTGIEKVSAGKAITEVAKAVCNKLCAILTTEEEELLLFLLLEEV